MFKTKRLRSLLKQISLFDKNLSFEENNCTASIRYNVPLNLNKNDPLKSYVVLTHIARKPRDKYVGLFMKMFGEIPKFAYDSLNLNVSSLDEYVLKVLIRGGK